jgi:hypothetical protein
MAKVEHQIESPSQPNGVRGAMTPAGSEQPQISSENSRVSSGSGTESGTPGIVCPQDPGLLRVVKAWPRLPKAVKDSILLLMAASNLVADA